MTKDIKTKLLFCFSYLENNFNQISYLGLNIA